jgi:hypothetical protein
MRSLCRHFAKCPATLLPCFCDAAFAAALQLLVYSTFLALGVVTAWRAPWVLDTWQFWEGWPNHEFT